VDIKKQQQQQQEQEQERNMDTLGSSGKSWCVALCTGAQNN